MRCHTHCTLFFPPRCPRRHHAEISQIGITTPVAAWGEDETGQKFKCEAPAKERRMQKRLLCSFVMPWGLCSAFWKPILPLLRAPRLTCSVASLGLYPGHHLRKCHCLHRDTAADCQPGQGLPSSCTTRHSMVHNTPTPKVTGNPNRQSHAKRLHF